jgi:hypothetical protein
LNDQEIRELLDEAANALESVSGLVASIDAGAVTSDEWILTSARVGESIARYNAAAKRLSAGLGVSSAQHRLLRFLQLRLGDVVDKDELSGVAAIHEWPRRVRELRVEEGWRIGSSKTRDDLRPGEYILEADKPDEELVADWRIAHEVRGLSGGAKGRLITYLRRIFPRSADKQRLAYVAKIQEWPRRMRELSEEGWRVMSNVDDPELAPGDYRLAALDQLPPLTREAIKLRYQILDRDGLACRDCGRSPKQGDRVVLQIHHVCFVSHGGTNAPENLITLCSECHAGRHSNVRRPTGDELLPGGSDTFRD